MENDVTAEHYARFATLLPKGKGLAPYHVKITCICGESFVGKGRTEQKARDDASGKFSRHRGN